MKHVVLPTRKLRRVSIYVRPSCVITQAMTTTPAVAPQTWPCLRADGDSTAACCHYHMHLHLRHHQRQPQCSQQHQHYCQRRRWSRNGYGCGCGCDHGGEAAAGQASHRAPPRRHPATCHVAAHAACPTVEQSAGHPCQSASHRLVQRLVRRRAPAGPAVGATTARAATALPRCTCVTAAGHGCAWPPATCCHRCQRHHHGPGSTRHPPPPQTTPTRCRQRAGDRGRAVEWQRTPPPARGCSAVPTGRTVAWRTQTGAAWMPGKNRRRSRCSTTPANHLCNPQRAARRDRAH